MSSSRKKSESKKGKFPVVGITAGVAFVVVGVLVGFLLEGIYRKSPTIDTRTSTEAAKAGEPGAPGSSSARRRAPAIGDRATPTRPRAAGDQPLPPGFEPSTPADDPPPDDRYDHPAPESKPPPDPATYRPPMHNPGGVNGDRPPRPIPGVE